MFLEFDHFNFLVPNISWGSTLQPISNSWLAPALLSSEQQSAGINGAWEAWEGYAAHFIASEGSFVNYLGQSSSLNGASWKYQPPVGDIVLEEWRTLKLDLLPQYTTCGNFVME